MTLWVEVDDQVRAGLVRARAWPTLTTEVVLPVPPFWLAKTMVFMVCFLGFYLDQGSRSLRAASKVAPSMMREGVQLAVQVQGSWCERRCAGPARPTR